MKKFLNFVFCTIFIAYFLILLDTVFFFRTGDSMRSVNLIPFKSITQYVNVYDGIRHKLVDMNIWGNILMFIPFGIYLMIFLKEKSLIKGVLITVFTSLIIEIVQFTFALGSSDIDDIILNTIGGLIGILIYKILMFITKDSKKVKTIITILSGIVGFPVIFITIMLYVYNS